MPNFDLQVAISETVKDLLGDTLEHRKATSAAITPDGRVSPQAVAGALPWQAHDGMIEGEVETGSNRLRWHFPQGGVIRQVSFDVRTPPSGGNLEFSISGGTTTETISLQAEQMRGVANTSIVMPAGSWARVNVTSAAGASDLAVTLQYDSFGSGGTSSPGGGSSGGSGTISVISVNGQTGVVELDADDIQDTSTSNKFVTDGDLAKLNGIESGAQVNVTPTWASVTGKPTTFPPTPHNHDEQYYTQDDVEALVNRWRTIAAPPVFTNTTFTVSSAGFYALAETTVTGMVQGVTYRLQVVGGARATITSARAQFSPRATLSGNVQPNQYVDMPSGTVMSLPFNFGLTITAGASGSMPVGIGVTWNGGNSNFTNISLSVIAVPQ